jgi:hypothetical protein
VATARQIARDYAGLPPGPGFDVAPQLPLSRLPLLTADDIDWEMAPAETIPAEGGNLRASTISYRELALTGIHGLHELQHQHDRLVEQHHRLHDELRSARAANFRTKGPEVEEDILSTPKLRQNVGVSRPPLSGLSGVRGVR